MGEKKGLYLCVPSIWEFCVLFGCFLLLLEGKGKF